ncbi:unnamed protein product [Owenia fusiformis]|uniref:Uncharacterized protein n=1 Tax=Owenia fusiformis TaxID=6347 RepID=A0A8J1XX69_OWEFU|nr:unnamed protein product [Owenia fusiformis]
MANFGSEDDIEMRDESKRMLREMIMSYGDSNDDGIIQKDELGDCLAFIGINIMDEESMDAVIEHFDTNEDGHISIDEIVDQWEVLQVHSLHSDELLKSFKKIDANGDGFIRLPELKAVLTKKGKNQFSGEEASAVLQKLMKYDEDHDGKFSYPEFVKMFSEDEFPFKRIKGLTKKKLPDAKQKQEQ